MNKLSLTLALAGGLAMFGGQVAAQTCAAPLPIVSNQQNVLGDTCTATNTLPAYGGTSSTQNEIVYSFVAQSAAATISITPTGGFAGSTAAIFLLPTCTSSTDPIAFGFAGSPMTVGGLTNGQTYFVVVTADPSAAPAGCGQFDVDVTGILPVALQKFSVE